MITTKVFVYPSLKKYRLLNLHLAEVQMEQIFGIFFWARGTGGGGGGGGQVNLWLFLEQILIMFLLIFPLVIFSKKLLFELRQKSQVYP